MPSKNRDYMRKKLRSFEGRPRVLYSSMLGRVKGTQGRARTKHLYRGKAIMPLDKFMKWTLNDPGYKRIFKKWVASGYNVSLSPSPNRIDTDRGYVAGNLEWITLAKNCANVKRVKRRKA